MAACSGGGGGGITPPTTYILTVNSAAPSSGVSITVSPADNSGAGNGSTSFTRTYNSGKTITLTAPATAGGNNFFSWTGCTSANTLTCTVTLSASTTVTANYATPTNKLTVNSTSPASGVAITVTPADNSSQGNGNTSFTRTYNTGTAIMLTAPATAGGNNFSSWTGCTTANSTTCDVTLNADTTVTANYAATGSSATVDFGATQQTIRGFGGSSAWISNFTGAQADALYGNTSSQQIGLTILRVRIDPAPDPGNHSNWDTELNNAQKASARGAIVFASPWSPPASMKSNNDVNNGGSLNAFNYGDYANYLESFVTYMQQGGVSLYAISMQNEPDWVANYDSCTWTAQQMDTWVAVNSYILTTRLIMPESAGFNQALSDPSLDDPNAVGHIAIIGGHLYGSSPTYYTKAINLGKDVWMTEHAISDTGITGAMELAKEVHDSMTVANYNAYVYWWLQNWTGGNYLNGLLDEQGNPTLNGDVMGQFSKFVRPGYVRTTATANPNANVYVSAYKGNGHYVIVAINTGTIDLEQPFAIQNQAITSMTPYRTTAAGGLQQQGAVSITNNSFSYILPAESITTFVE